VNIAEIDEQHKKLVNLVNELDAAMVKGKGKDALGKTFSALINYTKTHFGTEERIMKTHGYPDYEEHKAKHDAMTQKVLNLHKEFQQGKVTITLDTMNFLQDWLAKHILGTDMKYAPYLSSKGVK
jgi:hemerythrin